MVGAFGLIDAPEVALLVPREDVADRERGHGGVAVHQRHRVAAADAARELARDGKRDRDGPGVLAALVLDDPLVEDAMVGGLVHRAGEGREPAIAEAIDAGEIGVGDGHLHQLRRLGEERCLVGGGDHAVHGLGEAAVGRNQIGHVGMVLSRRGSENGQT